jgi:hypothetical protein
MKHHLKYHACLTKLPGHRLTSGEDFHVFYQFLQADVGMVRTAKRTQPVTITNINLLTQFKDIIPVYTENNLHNQ